MVTEKETEVEKTEEEVDKSEATVIKVKEAVEYIYCM